MYESIKKGTPGISHIQGFLKTSIKYKDVFNGLDSK